MFRLLFCIALFFIVFPSRGGAAEVYAGQWQMTSMSLAVKVDSWGEYCGPRPVSYTSKKIRPVTIRAQGKHLLFSTGGLRTDRCGSPNPKLRKISANASPGSWKMVCETERNDPKYERGVYTLVAKGDNTLEFKAESKFDWTLKGDHCIAISKERRVFVRAPTTADPAPQKVETPVREPEPEAQVREAEPSCEPSGPIKKISIQPKSRRLGPGESVCFKAFAVDEGGCRTQASASWTAMQNERIVQGLLKPSGCFRAGNTAADAEGTYIVTARVGQKSDTAEVTVVFPDLGELFAARLRPLQEIEEGASDEKENAQDNLAPAPKALPVVAGNVTLQKNEEDEETSNIFWAIMVLLGVALVGFTTVIVLGMKRRGAQTTENELWEEPVVRSRQRQTPPDKIRAPKEEENQQVAKKIRCPKCGAEFPAGARFCPHDGSALETPQEKKNDDVIVSDTRISAGMVCPNCHRGYELGARFCPHDSSKLVPYENWSKNRTGRRQKI